MSEISSKIAGQVLQKAFENSQSEAKPLSSDGATTFNELLQNTEGTFDFASTLGIGDTSTKRPVQTVSAESISFEMNGEAKNIKVGGADSLVNMLSNFNDQQWSSENLVNSILFSDKKFNPHELLAIEAHVFHVAQMTEMTVKAVELTVSSFKGVMNTQIQ